MCNKLGPFPHRNIILCKLSIAHQLLMEPLPIPQSPLSEGWYKRLLPNQPLPIPLKTFSCKLSDALFFLVDQLVFLAIVKTFEWRAPGNEEREPYKIRGSKMLPSNMESNFIQPLPPLMAKARREGGNWEENHSHPSGSGSLKVNQLLKKEGWHLGGECMSAKATIDWKERPAGQIWPLNHFFHCCFRKHGWFLFRRGLASSILFPKHIFWFLICFFYNAKELAFLLLLKWVTIGRCFLNIFLGLNLLWTPECSSAWIKMKKKTCSHCFHLTSSLSIKYELGWKLLLFRAIHRERMYKLESYFSC